MVIAGVVVVPNFVDPFGNITAGVPAKVFSDLADFEKQAKIYMKYSQLTLESLHSKQ
jgi:hypothetical protein